VASPPRPTALTHIRTWVFDLDNTLYPASAHVFPQIDVRMKQFIAEYLNMTLEEAFTLQKAYYHTYGTTLRGLMLNHGLEPDRFLDYVHAIDHSVLAPDPALDQALAALPGRKIVFTNGSESHAVNVVERLGIARHFEGIFDIKAAAYIPKPEPETYRALVERFVFDPCTAAMFEDSPANLTPAAAIGMTTVLVRAESCQWCHAPEHTDSHLEHCDYVTDDLIGWLASAGAEFISA